MQNKMIINTALIVLLLAISGCSQTKEAGVEFELDIERAIREGGRKSAQFDLSRVGRLERQFILQDSLLSSSRFYPCDEESVFVKSFGKMYRADIKDGSIMAEYAKKGRGPMEFIDVWAISRIGEEVFLDDVLGQKVLICSLDGKPTKKIATDYQVTAFAYAPDRFVRCYPMGHPKNTLFEITTTQGEVLRTSDIPLINQDLPIVYINEVTVLDGNLCICQNQSNTYYRITEDKDIPWIKLNLGSYEMPMEYKKDLARAQMLSSTYVYGDIYLIIIGDLAFVSFYFDGPRKIVYEMTSGEILFNLHPGENDSIQGLPMEYNGEKYSVWPLYVDDKHVIFGTIGGSEQWLFSR